MGRSEQVQKDRRIILTESWPDRINQADAEKYNVAISFLSNMDRDFQRAYRQSTSSVLECLEKALQWLGLEHGRVANYKKLLAEYYEGQRSNEHFFAFYRLWMS